MTDETSDKSEAPAPEAEAPAAEAPESDDVLNQEALARRVAALGKESEEDRIAREEEEKLASRRAANKRGKKGGGLEAAASKRLSKIGSKSAPAKRNVALAADVDPLLKRTSQLSKWAKDNQKGLVAVVLVGVLGLAGVAGYNAWQDHRDAAASTALEIALDDAHGRVGDQAKLEEAEEANPNGPRDTSPVFKTVEERRDAALAKLREVETSYKGTGAAYLARLEEGGLLLDKRDAAGALAAYQDVSSSPLAQADIEVKGRALEGIGFAYELLAQTKDRDTNLDQAAKTFRELENTDVKGFKELGMYHQARVAEEKGDKDKAISTLKSLHERLVVPGESHPFPYLEEVADDRLRQLDPTAIPPKRRGEMGGPGGNQLTQEQIQKLIQQMQQQQGGGGGGAPPMPMPGPPK